MDFETLANQHKDAVYRQMIRVCGNREDAEDVLIEALLKAYCHLDQLRDSGVFRAWLAQIARRVCWQLRRRESLLPLLQLSAVEDEGRQIRDREPSPESQAAVNRMKEQLAQVIRDLPQACRTVYEMRDLEQLSGEEVARRVGISIATMKSRLHRARGIIRQELDRALASTSERG